MDEFELMALIAEGEHDGIDFKRELHLDSKQDKGEFVKDVLSIANSAPSNKADSNGFCGHASCKQVLHF